MNKTRYRDYAVSAFEFYGKLYKPRSARLAEYRLKEYALRNRTHLSDAQFAACMADLVACIEALQIIQKRKDADDILAALQVYTDYNYGTKNAISSGVVKTSLKQFTSEASIYRRLSICRDIFAECRGLRVVAL